MIHFARWMAILLLTVNVLGCGKPASKNPGEWNQSQVEDWVREKIPLSELKLAPDGEKTYTGTGREASGKDYEIRVTQTENKITCEFTWTNGNGKGSGNFSYGVSAGPPIPPKPPTS